MVKAIYIMLACNLMAAAVFFVGGITAGNPLMNLLGWIFVAASVMLLVFVFFMRRKFPTLK
jgi:FtsH-binding integral membrane protein